MPVLRPNVDPELCFVLMPFRPPFTGYYDQIIKPAVSSSGLRVRKADEIYGTRPVIKDIWDHIWKARVVIADVTGKNPNVNYELGLCHALNVPTILLTQSQEDIPFDYTHRRYIRYRTADAGWEAKLREDIIQTIAVTLKQTSDEEELVWPYDISVRLLSHVVGDISDSAAVREEVFRGLAKTAQLCATAYGPLGGHVAINSSGTSLLRGIDVANSLKTDSPLESQGVDIVRRLASDVSSEVGDGEDCCVAR